MKKGGKDISTQFTKQQDRECGRKGYVMHDREKEDVISPRDYGTFIQNRRRRK